MFLSNSLVAVQRVYTESLIKTADSFLLFSLIRSTFRHYMVIKNNGLYFR